MTEAVRLIDSQTLDPSDVDIARIVRPPGVDLGALQQVVQPVLDALPDVTVPATVARVRVAPNERIESGTRLIQRALRAEITIAGQRLADLVVGEAIVGVGDVSCGGVTCRDWQVVKRFRPRPDGRFRVRLKAPRDGEAAVYRMSTRVKLYDWFPKSYPTFTLPHYVDLG